MSTKCTLAGELGNEMFPKGEVKNPHRDAHLLFALLAEDLLNHIVAKFRGAVDHHGLNGRVLQGNVQAGPEGADSAR